MPTTLVFLPGIMGSELVNSNNEVVWPPTIWEAKVGGYRDINRLLDDNLRATQPIRDIAYFFNVYDCLLKDIDKCGYTIDGNERAFLPFAYDWRRPNADTAALLSNTLMDTYSDIIFIGHSMGSLVIRHLLESGLYDHKPWFRNVKQVITFGAPYLGAPSALSQIAGQKPNLGISRQDLVTLTSDPRFSAPYELVPHDGTAIVQQVAVNGELPQKMNAFDPAIVNRYGFNLPNIRNAYDLWQSLNIASKPDHVDYFFFVGSAHRTESRTTWNGNDIYTMKYDRSGDGTVPISSAMHAAIPHAYSEKKHAKLFEDRKVRRELYRMLDAPAGVVPHSAPDNVEIDQPDAVGLSIDNETYEPGDTMEVVVSYVSPQTDPELVLQMALIDIENKEGPVLDHVGAPISVALKGVSATTFSFNIVVDLDSGIYELLVNQPTDDPSRLLFAVTEGGME